MARAKQEINTPVDKDAANRAMRSALAKLPPVTERKFEIKPPELLPGVVPPGTKPGIAMDSSASGYDIYAYAQACMPSNYQGFPGYPYLASLATRAEYRAFAATLSTELTREWITITCSDDEYDNNPRVTELEQAIEEYNLRGVFKTLAEHDCFFGRAQLSINILGADDKTPLVLDPRTVRKGRLKSFTPVEAMWTTPNVYNAIDPTSPDFYRPTSWFMLGKEVHASRLLTIVTRPLPDMLKPAYNFSGMSLSQLAEPYVENWLRTRQAVSDLINNFSITALKTNMSQVLQGNDLGANVFDRADLFTLTRSNKGLMLLDMEMEELVQMNTPLSGLHELQAQAQEHMCSVSKIPAMILTGISPSGLNASSDGEIRAFYDWISAQQEAYWKHPLMICLKLIMLDLWGEIDQTIGFEFNPLWQMSDDEKSQIRLRDAQTNAIYIENNIVSVEEVRTNIAADPNSGFSGLDVEDIPEVPEDPIEGVGQFANSEEYPIGQPEEA